MEVDDSFYLTGGTALGRHYLNHRYSDDLDLFVNRNTDFKKLTDVIISRIKTHYPRTDIVLSGEDFARIFRINHNAQRDCQRIKIFPPS